MELYPDAGNFFELLERQERKLRKTGPSRTAPMEGQLTERQLEVLRLLDGELLASELGKLPYVSPSTIRSHVNQINAHEQKEQQQQIDQLEKALNKINLGRTTGKLDVPNLVSSRQVSEEILTTVP